MCTRASSDNGSTQVQGSDTSEPLDTDEPNDDLDEGLAPSVDEEAPESIAHAYDLCIDYVRRAVGMTLDFTDETLPILDHYVALARDDLRNRPELGQLLQGAIGAYFGELVRRRLHGYWWIPNPDVHSWRVCARHVFLSFNPIGVACEALARGDDNDGPSGELNLAHEDEALVGERLAKAPPVPEAHYYLLSTRLEAIDIAVEALRLAMQQGGHAAVEFELNDYADAIY
jgi:hypothetical protein